MTWSEQIEQYLRDWPDVSGGKGSGEAKTQMKAAEARNQQAFNTQQAQLASLNKAFSPYTQQDIGFSQPQLADMNAQAIANNAGQFNAAGQGVRSALLQRGSGGGNLPVGGDYVRGISSLMGARASDLSGQLSNIRLQSAQQALVNKFNAGNLLSGNAATLTGTQGVQAGQASDALKSYIQAKNSGFLQSFGQGLGAGLGGGLGAGISGGIGTAASKVGSGNWGW